jgi:hypothetical protein
MWRLRRRPSWWWEKNGLTNPQCFILDDNDGVHNLRTELGHLTDHPTRRFSAPFYSPRCGGAAPARPGPRAAPPPSLPAAAPPLGPRSAPRRGGSAPCPLARGGARPARSAPPRGGARRPPSAPPAAPSRPRAALARPPPLLPCSPARPRRGPGRFNRPLGRFNRPGPSSAARFPVPASPDRIFARPRSR